MEARGRFVDVHLEGLVVIVGSYGSGKSEVAVNLALHHREAGLAVRLADLDLVNPYFRSREAAGVLAGRGVEVVLPPADLQRSELPVLSPMVAGLLRRPAEGLTLLDVGGDGVGARVLAALQTAFAGRPYRMLLVVNPLRPATATLGGCLKIRAEIEAAAGLKVTGLIGNANLIEETTAELIRSGLGFMQDLSRASGLPLVCITAPEDLAAELGAAGRDCPVLAIRRQLVPPWVRAGRLPATSNKRPAGS
jgi:hypothetical protein